MLGASEGGFVRGSENAADQHVWWDKWDLDPASSKKKRKREQEAPVQVSISESMTLDSITPTLERLSTMVLSMCVAERRGEAKSEDMLH